MLFRSRQFEFVQHSWVNNPTFAGLHNGADPLVGPAGSTFRVPTQPVARQSDGIPSFVTVRGGAYFFMPGIAALRFLGSTRE